VNGELNSVPCYDNSESGMKTVFKYTLWFFTICALLAFAFSIISIAASLRYTALAAQTSTLLITKELADTRTEMRETLDRLPGLARDTANKAAGGAIDASNPLRNAADEAKRTGKKIEGAAHDVKDETNRALKRAGIPIRF
jgi:hypothetical protein